MSEIPMEYKVMKKKFVKSIQTAIDADLEAIIVFGGAASERVFSGVSDIDFMIILKAADSLSQPLSAIYSALSETFKPYLEDPLFSSILDYEIYLLDQLPTRDSLNGFSPIKAFVASKGETLYGKNPFEGLTVNDKELKSGARTMIQDYLDKLTSVLFMASFELDPESGEEVDNGSLETEKIFLSVDAVLSSAQAYQMLKRNSYVNMPDVVLYAETEPIEGIDNKLLQEAGLLKQGVETEIEDFHNKAIDFVASVLKILK